MKPIQKYRFGAQVLFLILTIVGFLTYFKITMLAILILTAVSGTFYCGWICPYGFMQELGGKLGKLLGIKKVKMPKPFQKVLMFTRYILLAIVSFLTLDIIFTIMSFDPRANFLSLLSGSIGSFLAVVVMIFFVIVSMFFERPFCNYLCYEGAKYGLISFLRLFTIKRDASKCVGCKKCDKVCPMNIEVSKCSQLRSPQCINCFECVSSCPVKETLSYGKIHFTPYEIKRYTTMILVLSIGIISFIGYTIYNTKALAANQISSSQEIAQPEESDKNFGTADDSSIQTAESENKDSVLPNDDASISVSQSDVPSSDASSAVSTAPSSSDKANATQPKASSVGSSNTSSSNSVSGSSSSAKASSSSKTGSVDKSSVQPSNNSTAAADNNSAAQDAGTSVDSSMKISGDSAAALGDAAGIADGVYTGSGEGFKGTTTVNVTIKDQKITAVEVVDTRDDRRWFQRAYDGIVSSILESQSTDVDTVGGATYSSRGIIAAVKDALANAK